jgi:hypothetical protein
MASFEYEPYFPLENREPFEIISLSGVLYRLSSENTQIRRYEFGIGEFDHILHAYYHDREEDRLQGILIFLDLVEEMDPGLTERLEANNTPVKYLDRPDEMTMSAYAAMSAEELDDGVPTDFDE